MPVLYPKPSATCDVGVYAHTQTNTHINLQANILAAIGWLVKNCQPSDSLFFSFSGHGCQPPHLTGGSWDESILPSDFQQVSLITVLAPLISRQNTVGSIC